MIKIREQLCTVAALHSVELKNFRIEIIVVAYHAVRSEWTCTMSHVNPLQVHCPNRLTDGFRILCDSLRISLRKRKLVNRFTSCVRSAMSAGFNELKMTFLAACVRIQFHYMCSLRHLPHQMYCTQRYRGWQTYIQHSHTTKSLARWKTTTRKHKKWKTTRNWVCFLPLPLSSSSSSSLPSSPSSWPSSPLPSVPCVSFAFIFRAREFSCCHHTVAHIIRLHTHIESERGRKRRKKNEKKENRNWMYISSALLTKISQRIRW